MGFANGVWIYEQDTYRWRQSVIHKVAQDKAWMLSIPPKYLELQYGLGKIVLGPVPGMSYSHPEREQGKK
jgi:hypothetical protein